MTTIAGYSSALTLDLIRICQGDSGLITCPEGLALKIYSAQYGRFVSGSVSKTFVKKMFC